MLQILTDQLNPENKTNVKNWLEEHCVGKFYYDYRHDDRVTKSKSSIWFELEDDKALFILTWLK